MKKLFTLLGFLLFSAGMFAQYPGGDGLNVTTLWEQSDETFTNPDYNTGGNCRGMALGMQGGTPYLYVVSRADGQLGTHILNPATGEDIGMLINPSADLMAQGQFSINTVEVSEDGVIFVSSMTGTNGKFLNVYMYKNHTAEPKLMYSITRPAGLRLGDRFSVTGRYSDGSAKLYFSDHSAAHTVTVPTPWSCTVYALKLVADPGATGEYVCELENGVPKTIDANPDPECKNANMSIYRPVGAGNAYYWMSSTGGLYYNNGSSGSRIYPDQFTNRTTRPFYVGEKNGKHYMCCFDFESQRAYLVSYTLPETSGGATIEAITPGFRTPTGNYGSAQGCAEVAWRGAHPIIYLLAPDYGIGAYEVSTIDTGVKTIVEDQYSVKQNGSVLQVTGKEAIQSIELISLTGQQVAVSRNASEISAAVSKGVYLISIKSISGQRSVQKVLID
ncbi:MAG: hypothetical protein LBN93_05685 [Candidatus Symbiothrix sp.]|jgi:hypothetical protein|nr:hypothetical protein [Candidatus Symbiothrix sp.]